ncbi:MAG TPA: hypothetical protein VL576_03365 [Candidatus Paceibacterota bacterium]|jgi:hypothetical protein|nr:hypothetical protein [Candidatus Paceibacterota bacterium]
MKILFVLLEESFTDWQVAVLIAVFLIAIFCIYKIFFSKDKKEDSTPSDLALYLADETGWDDGENKTSEQKQEEVKETIPEPDEYVVDENDANLFHNKRYSDFSLRMVFAISTVNKKDVMILTSSLPLQFNKSTFNIEKKELLATIPQIVNVTKSEDHGIALQKSPASKWDDIKDAILRFFFIHMHHVYAWKFEKQIVLISTVPNPDMLNFEMRLETKYHLELGRKLCAIKGMGGSSSLHDGLPICMDHDKHYDFGLGKATAYTWKELLPKIKKVFEDYFPAGVEFKSAPSQYSDEDFQRIHRSRHHDDFFMESLR